MKKVLLIIAMILTSSNLFAHNISIVNDDGTTIYYIWTNNKTELAVSYRGSTATYFSNEYFGNVGSVANY